MANISREDKLTEAVLRMKKLSIFPETIRPFEEDGKISISEPPMGAFYWAEGEDLERIRRFEEQHNALVYVVIRSYTTIGKMDCYLFVNDHVEEWERDRKSLEAPGDGVFSYVYNFDDPDCSEFGDIGVAKTPAAGLRRTC